MVLTMAAVAANKGIVLNGLEVQVETRLEEAGHQQRTTFVTAIDLVADLTDRDLVLGKLCGPFGEKVYYAYVKLVPLSPEEVAALQSERAQTEARTLAGSIDGISYF